MELKYLKEFIVLSEIGNYTSAADELYISQSSLSKHIQALETELGVPLFDRTTRKITLTSYGRSLLPYAIRVADICDEANETLTRMTQYTDTSLRLGLLPSFAAYGIIEAVTRLKKEHSILSVTMQEGGLPDLKKLLLDGSCNLIISRSYQAEEDPRFVQIPLARDRAVVVMPFGHPLDDGSDSISIRKLEGQELITSNSPNMARMLRELAEEENVHFTIPIRLGRSEHIIRMMQSENRIAVLLKKPTEYNYAGKFRVMDLLPLKETTLVAMHLKDDPPNTAVKLFLKYAPRISGEEEAHAQTEA